MKHRVALAVTVAIALPSTFSLAACTPALAVSPAPAAADPRCAEVMLAVPETLAGLKMRATTSQATAAWGAEYGIVARCGVAPPEPTTDPCVTLEAGRYSVDWVTQDVGDYRIAVSYGKDPALEIAVPLIRADKAVGEILAQLSPAAALADDTGRACVGAADAEPANAEPVS